jgi:hypothetical protein
VKKEKLDNLIKAIVPLNNVFREGSRTSIERLLIMWEIGNELVEHAVNSPHSCGWAIQEKTKGLIKRPTIFRSYKVRSIWPSKESLKQDLGKIKTLSNFTTILPLIDPNQPVRKKMSKNELQNLFQLASNNQSNEFKSYVEALKAKYSHGSLGKKLDKSKHLKDLSEITNHIKRLNKELSYLIIRGTAEERELFRSQISEPDRKTLSNMFLALTTKENFKLYRPATESGSSSTDYINRIYDSLIKALDKTSDVDRARFRRLLDSNFLANISDMLSSIGSEKSIEDFKMRASLTIDL